MNTSRWRGSSASTRTSSRSRPRASRNEAGSSAWPTPGAAARDRLEADAGALPTGEAAEIGDVGPDGPRGPWVGKGSSRSGRAAPICAAPAGAVGARWAGAWTRPGVVRTPGVEGSLPWRPRDPGGAGRGVGSSRAVSGDDRASRSRKGAGSAGPEASWRQTRRRRVTSSPDEVPDAWARRPGASPPCSGGLPGVPVADEGAAGLPRKVTRLHPTAFNTASTATSTQRPARRRSRDGGGPRIPPRGSPRRWRSAFRSASRMNDTIQESPRLRRGRARCSAVAARWASVSSPTIPSAVRPRLR